MLTRRVYIYFVLTFLLGALCGGGGLYYYAWSTGHWHNKVTKEMVIKGLSHDLRLNAEQAEQLRSIMDAADQKYRALHQQVEPQFAALHRETQQKIRQILTPAQVQKFNEMVRRYEAKKKKEGN
jgi:Spy/CpxP family protein refolding chaperone